MTKPVLAIQEICQSIGLRLIHNDGPTSILCIGSCTKCGDRALRIGVILGESHVWIQESPDIFKWQLVDFTEPGPTEKLREILVSKHS